MSVYDAFVTRAKSTTFLQIDMIDAQVDEGHLMQVITRGKGKRSDSVL